MEKEKDYSKYTKFQVELGGIDQHDMIISASMLSSVINACYVVSSLNDENLPLSSTLAPGDIAIVSAKIGDTANIQRVAYVWNDELFAWTPLDENYDLKNVFFDDDIVLTEKFGHHNVPLCGHYTLDSKGKSMYEVFKDAYQVAKSGSKTPPTFEFSLCSYTSSKEVGSTYVVPGATLKMKSVGTYQYGTATNKNSTNNSGISVAINDATISSSLGVIHNDSTVLTTNSTLSQPNGTATKTYTDSKVDYQYKASAEWLSGNIPLNNLGSPDKISSAISAGLSTFTLTASFTGYRCPFWGNIKYDNALTADYENFHAAVSAKNWSAAALALNSNDVRSLSSTPLGNKGSSTAGLPSTLSCPVGTKFIVFAAKKGTKNTLVAKDANALNALVTFAKVSSIVEVNGYNGYTPTPYDIWYFRADTTTGIDSSKYLCCTWS